MEYAWSERGNKFVPKCSFCPNPSHYWSPLHYVEDGEGSRLVREKKYACLAHNYLLHEQHVVDYESVVREMADKIHLG